MVLSNCIIRVLRVMYIVTSINLSDKRMDPGELEVTNHLRLDASFLRW